MTALYHSRWICRAARGRPVGLLGVCVSVGFTPSPLLFKGTSLTLHWVDPLNPLWVYQAFQKIFLPFFPRKHSYTQQDEGCITQRNNLRFSPYQDYFVLSSILCLLSSVFEEIIFIYLLESEHVFGALTKIGILKSWLVYFLNKVTPWCSFTHRESRFNSAWLMFHTVANVAFATLLPALLSPFFFYSKITGISKCRPMQTIIGYLEFFFVFSLFFVIVGRAYVSWQASL